jgi:hypothetical protein
MHWRTNDGTPPLLISRKRAFEKRTYFLESGGRADLLHLRGEEAEAYELADDIRKRRARNPHARPEDEERREEDVEHGAAHDRKHREEALPLEAQLHVEHEGSCTSRGRREG